MHIQKQGVMVTCIFKMSLKTGFLVHNKKMHVLTSVAFEVELPTEVPNILRLFINT